MDSISPGRVFIKLLSNVPLSEMICRPCQLKVKVKVTIEDQKFEPLNCVPFISCLSLEGFSLNFDKMFTSMRQCAEPINQPCRHKAMVTVGGYGIEP